MKILFIHHGYPGQFKHLVKRLINRGDEISVISPQRPISDIPSGIKYYGYSIKSGNGVGTHRLALETETKVIRGEAVGHIAEELNKLGYTPELIVCHPGWGESLFLRDIWENTPQLHYIEFIYKSTGLDLDFDDEYVTKPDWKEKARSRMKNANTYLSLADMNWGLTPTKFQYNLIPEWARNKTSVVHEGIDTEWATPDLSTKLKVSPERVISTSDNVVTFINRTFEPYRGIHKMIEAIEDIQMACPETQFILVGKDSPKVSYGSSRTDGKGWLKYLKEKYTERINWNNVHHVGKVSHDRLRDIYRISSVHVYLTYPFVLSWSLLEAMSCECTVVGSRTAPVEEVIESGENGILVDFANSKELAEKVVEILNNKQKYTHLGQNARETIIKRYSLNTCLEKQLTLIDAIKSGSIAA